VRRAASQMFYGGAAYPVRVRTAYRCRAYPDDTQASVLNRTFGCVRVVWNRTLAERHRLYHADGKSLS
jgi:putative transposase